MKKSIAVVQLDELPLWKQLKLDEMVGWTKHHFSLQKHHWRYELASKATIGKIIEVLYEEGLRPIVDLSEVPKLTIVKDSVSIEYLKGNICDALWEAVKDNIL